MQEAAVPSEEAVNSGYEEVQVQPIVQVGLEGATELVDSVEPRVRA